MPDYNKSVIYKIYDNTNSNVYYGSTCNVLKTRMSQHKCAAKSKGDCVSKQIILNGNYSYSAVENYPCNSRQELHTRERYWIENFDCINKQVPGRTIKEWQQDNKEKLKKQKAEWQQDNKEKLKKRQKEYRTMNKTKLKQYRTEYITKNKEQIKKRSATKIACECGSHIRRSDMADHRKTAKHAKLMTLICPPCPP